MFRFDLQLFGGGGKGGATQSSSYTPSPQQQQLWSYLVTNAGNAQSGVNAIMNQFNNGVNSQDFANQLGTAQSMIGNAQGTIGNLLNGELPSAYTDNMADAIRNGVNKTVGSAVNNLSNRGVINSSVTNKALNDIESNVADSMAKSYTNNIGTVGNIANSLIGASTAGYQPYAALSGLAGNVQSNFLTQPASAMNGTGTTTSQRGATSWGDMLTSAALGLGTGWIGNQIGLGK